MMFIKIHSHEELEHYWGSPLQKASEKGYPDIYDTGMYWVLIKDQIPIAYTTSIDCTDFVFVVNTYVRQEYRGGGLHSELLKYRNEALGSKTKVTIVNPIEESRREHLVKVIKRLGYEKIQKLSDISDLMSDTMYYGIDLEKHDVWRLDHEKQ